MKNNDNTQNFTCPENLMELFKNQTVTSDLRELMAANNEMDPDEHDVFSDDLIDSIARLCESSGEITPKSTVAKLEGLVLSSKFKPNYYFIDRYANCLRCSCHDQDESYIQNAVDKLRMIIDNLEDIHFTNITDYYIACLSKLSIKQEPAQAMQTIFELKSIGDATSAWDNTDNILEYCIALNDLCSKQSNAGDARAYDTLKSIESIINANGKIDNVRIFLFYAYAVWVLYYYGIISSHETFERMTEIASKSNAMENELFAERYINVKQQVEMKQIHPINYDVINQPEISKKNHSMKKVEEYGFTELLDEENKGIIIAHNRELSHSFCLVDGKWERTGLWSDYMFAGIFPESPKNETDYREVSTDEAKQLLGEHFSTLP